MVKSFVDYCHDSPYIEFLGISVNSQGIFELETTQDMIGNYLIHAVHGGVLMSLLEITSAITVANHLQLVNIPKIINVNFNFFKPAHSNSVIYAKAELAKVGQRVIHINALAYLKENSKKLASLNANYLAPNQ